MLASEMKHEHEMIYFGRGAVDDVRIITEGHIAYHAHVYHVGTKYGYIPDEVYVFTPRFESLQAADDWFQAQCQESGNVFELNQSEEVKRDIAKRLLNWLSERFL